MGIIEWWCLAAIYEAAIPHQDLQTVRGRAINLWLCQIMLAVSTDTETGDAL